MIFLQKRWLLLTFIIGFLFIVSHSVHVAAQGGSLLDEYGDASEAEAYFALTEDNDITDDEGDEIATRAHLSLFEEETFPSAFTCKTCHPQHFKEWSVSQHAYGQLSPVFIAMQNKINFLTSGSLGDFCIRCHGPVGMALGESVYKSNLERHPVTRQGVTCTVCHRIDKSYGKVSGRQGFVEGPLQEEIFGPKGNALLQQFLDANENLSTAPGEPGKKIHGEVQQFADLRTSGFCGSCHDVTVLNGFRFEELFSDFKDSPAAAKGVKCQDCHMGLEQGRVSGFKFGPAAIVDGVPTPPRKITNHFFAGPDFSIVHPGLFPHNEEAQEFATPEEWLEFDHKAGWGTPEFENNAAKVAKVEFPLAWEKREFRIKAREILDEQFDLLEFAETMRLEVMRNALDFGKMEVSKASLKRGVEIDIEMKNIMDGHSVPSGFDVERLIFVQVDVKDKNGKIVYRSGDLDPNGDVRDLHSMYVHNGELPEDKDLFTLQSRFITLNNRGGDREEILPVNKSVNSRPFVRPTTRSITMTGGPLGARAQRRSLPPLSTRENTYHILPQQLTGPGKYTAHFKLVVAMVPVALIHDVKDMGFDYGMTPREVADAVVDGHLVIRETDLEFEVK